MVLEPSSHGGCAKKGEEPYAVISSMPLREHGRIAVGNLDAWRLVGLRLSDIEAGRGIPLFHGRGVHFALPISNNQQRECSAASGNEARIRKRQNPLHPDNPLTQIPHSATVTIADIKDQDGQDLAAELQTQGRR